MVGCGKSNDSVGLSSPLERTIADSSKYSDSLKTDEEGRVDMSAVLASHSIVKSPKIKSIIEVKDSMGEPLSNIEVAYVIDKEKESIDLRYSDPSENLTTLYQHLSLKENNVTQNKVQYDSPLLLRFLSRAVLRSVLVYDTASTIKASYDLFNVEIEYEKSEDEVVFEGTVSEFYTFFDGLSNLKHLPFALSHNVVKLAKVSSAKGAIKFNSKVVRHLFLEFLKELGGYALVNNESKVRITLHKFDKESGFFSIDLVEEKIDDGIERELYDIIITQNGDIDHKFDYPVLDNVEPEFKGRVVVRDISYEIFKAESSYRAVEVLKNVPLSQGDILKVMVVDKDMAYDDDISSVEVIFDGVGEELYEDEFSTTKIEFLKAGSTPVKRAKKYDLNISINAIEDVKYDAFGNAPDFTGTIILSSGHFHIEEEVDSFVNKKIIKDVPIEMGEDITVKIIDKDIWFDDDIIEFNFIFDGKAYHEENRLAKVDIGFKPQ